MKFKEEYWCLPEDLTLDKKFTKKDICAGDKVTLRNGDELIYFDDMKVFVNVNDEKNNNPLSGISDLTNDLKYEDNKNYDIVKIERPTYKTVYQRIEEAKEMTVGEISEVLGYEVKIVKGGKDEK